MFVSGQLEPYIALNAPAYKNGLCIFLIILKLQLHFFNLSIFDECEPKL